MKQKARRFKLQRALGLGETTLYGIGIILGAGIYALIGTGAGIAGNAIWLSFIVAAFIAAFTGLSYAELSSMFPKEAAEYHYTKNAFGREFLSFIIAWVMIIAGTIAVTTVSLGFGGYFSVLFGGPPIIIAAALIVLLSLLNFWGIKDSARFNIVATVIEMSGLALVIAIGLWFFGTSGITTNLFELPLGVGTGGILAATLVIFFAYLGFEDIANMAEEIKDPRKNLPKALILSIVITTALFIAVAIAAVGVLGWQALSSTAAPLTAVVAKALGPSAAVIMSAIALFATANTVLIIMIAISRVLYGVAVGGAFPAFFAAVHPWRRTPYISVFVVGVASLTALLLGGIKEVALLTDLGIFVVYLFVNLSLIALRYSSPYAHRPFVSPSIGKYPGFPILAVLGVITCGAMILYFEPRILLYEAAVIAAGAAIYWLLRKRMP